MQWLISLGIGALAGWLAAQIMKSKSDLLTNLIVGILGSILGGILFSVIGLSSYGILGHLICATVGAVALIAGLRAIR